MIHMTATFFRKNIIYKRTNPSAVFTLPISYVKYLKNLNLLFCFCNKIAHPNSLCRSKLPKNQHRQEDKYSYNSMSGNERGYRYICGLRTSVDIICTVRFTETLRFLSCLLSLWQTIFSTSSEFGHFAPKRIKIV